MSFQHRFVQGLGVEKRTHPPSLLGRILLVITLLVLGTQAAQAVVQTCSNEWLPPGDIASPPDLKVTGRCSVKPGTTYYYGNVNILAGGLLLFYENYADGSGSITDFWASAIIIENGGELSAYGRDYDRDKNISWQAFGFNGGVLTIHLYGKNEVEGKPDQQNQGALCQSPLGAPGPGKTPAPCGIPQATWDSNGAIEVGLPGLVSDYFYQYGPLHGDGKCDDGSVFKVINGKGACDTSPGQAGYFGNKVLAVS
jgi:cell migration-inducing and hyaluronan-binding protein